MHRFDITKEWNNEILLHIVSLLIKIVTSDNISFSSHDIDKLYEMKESLSKVTDEF